MGFQFQSDHMDWETPQALYEQLDERFGFTLDVCATRRTRSATDSSRRT